MAEENVVIPRDKYNRMVEQLKNSKDDKLTQSTNDNREEATLTQSADIKHSDDVTQQRDDSIVVHTPRTRDDIVLNDAFHPPGLKNKDIDIFMKKFDKKQKKSRRNIKTKVTPSKSHTSRKSKLKANWISITK